MGREEIGTALMSKKWNAKFVMFLEVKEISTNKPLLDRDFLLRPFKPFSEPLDSSSGIENKDE